MSRHRRRRKKAREEEIKALKRSKSKGSNINITDLLKKADLGKLSDQLRNAANGLEKIGELTFLMEEVDILVKPKGASSKSSFNFMKLLTNGNSLNHLLQALMPLFNDSDGEKKVRPLNVETVAKSEKKSDEEGLG
ncbi:MAG: hypothetical protein PHT78_09620 [Desulfitobacteriaceae bacterium]|nr:hypothetical protein [Desulfitobacteriaceae bacterium]